jgi:helix-turn-helix protein
VEGMIPVAVRETDAARLIGVSVAALRRWRREKRGPRFLKLERCVRYRLADLNAFLDKNSVDFAHQTPSAPAVRTGDWSPE